MMYLYHVVCQVGIVSLRLIFRVSCRNQNGSAHEKSLSVNDNSKSHWTNV